LKLFNSLKKQPKIPSKYPGCVPICARENLIATNSSQNGSEK